MFRTVITKLGKRFMSNNAFVDKYTSLTKTGKIAVYSYSAGVFVYSFKSSYDGGIKGLRDYKDTHNYKDNKLDENLRWNYVYDGCVDGMVSSIPACVFWPAAIACKFIPQIIVLHDDKTMEIKN